VAAEFKALGLEVITGIGGHGLVGILDRGPGPCVMLRADMDALPVMEKTGLSFASRVRALDPQGQEVGVMHACGHDLHTTCLIGAAAVLSDLKDFLQGRVIFLAQPAEEAIGGARLMMAAGLYHQTGRPDLALALHVDSELPAGTVGLGPGVRSSASHSLDVTIRGRGGHGASPHLAKDPVVLAAQFILALQTIVTREIDPSQMALITVGAIHGGTKRNIIPAEVHLNLTLRAYSDSVRRQLAVAVARMAEGLARAAGLPPELYPLIQEPEAGYPPVINDPALTERLQSLFADLLGADRVLLPPPSTGSEDFGELGHTDPPMPMAYYQLGVTPAQRLAEAAAGGPPVPPEHDARFQPDFETSLPIGVSTLAGAALELAQPE
jgi:hippurate hydrolase